MAAAAHSTLVKGEEHLKRGDILLEMKGATAFYNKNYSSTLSKILDGLVKKKQRSPVAANTYSLPIALARNI